MGYCLLRRASVFISFVMSFNQLNQFLDNFKPYLLWHPGHRPTKDESHDILQISWH